MNEIITEHGMNGGNQEEEHHEHAVHREQLVIGLVRYEIAGRGRELEPHHHGERSADEEEEGDGAEIKERDAFVVARQQPRPDAVAVVQVMTWRKDDSSGHELFL